MEAAQPISIVAEKLKASERKREEKRLKQIQANRDKKAEQQAKEKKRKREGGEDEIINGIQAQEDADQDKQGEESDGTSKKRPRIQEDQEGRIDEEMDALPSPTMTISTISLSTAELSNDSMSMPPASTASTSQIPVCLSSPSGAMASCLPEIPMPDNVSSTPSKPQPPVITKINLSKALPEVRGHTSYLTFARLVSFSSSGLSSTSPTSAASVSTQILEPQIAKIVSDPSGSQARWSNDIGICPSFYEISLRKFRSIFIHGVVQSYAIWSSWESEGKLDMRVIYGAALGWAYHHEEDLLQRTIFESESKPP